MKNSMITIWLVLLGFLTYGYCLLIWFAAGVWDALLPAGSDESLPIVSLLALSSIAEAPWHMVHWQFLAVCSYLFCALRLLRASDTAQQANAALLHTVLVLGLALWQGGSALVPFVIVTHQL